MKCKVFSLAMAGVLALTGCAGGYVPVRPSQEPGPSAEPVILEKVTANELVLRLLESEAGQHDGENVILSPLSIEMALGMAANGAGEEAEAALGTLLGMDAEALNGLLGAYLRKEDDTLSISNAVWFNGRMEQVVSPEFRQAVTGAYGAQEGFFRRPRDPAEASVINNWVKEKTRGKIDSIVTADSLTEETLALLINALYFDGKWSEPFEDYQVSDGVFRAPGGEQEAELMSQRLGTYFEHGGFTGFSKEYEDGYEFIGILPEEDGCPDLAGLDIDAFLASETGKYDVDIRIPKFELEYTASLVKTLKALGLESLFAEGGMDGLLTEEAKEGGMEAHVSDVIHKTYMKMYEEGTEAAAVTAVMVQCTSAALPVEKQVKQVFLDRPFAFLIRDVESGQVVFCGVVNSVD